MKPERADFEVPTNHSADCLLEWQLLLCEKFNRIHQCMLERLHVDIHD